MRIAHYSPLPPARSGIADYSAALLEPLRRIAHVSVSEGAETAPGIPVYHLGNNPYHATIYERALREPGIAVMHEANLHHLLAEVTIKRGDWDGYLRELAYEGGAAAAEFGQRVRRLEAGPDYEGVPMVRRVLEASRGVIVHSRFVADALRRAGFQGPLGVIPHGAWDMAREPVDRMGWRQRLGLDARTPLIGIFGFLKPYKRIQQAAFAFRRLHRVNPQVRMILCGEAHPDLGLDQLLNQPSFMESTAVLGYQPEPAFTGYLAACDIILNLRYPTVGESSGTLLRAFSLGKAVLVSRVGSFLEYPDEICLKVPVDGREEDTLFEYLNLLVSRPEFAQEFGGRACEWVRRECLWDRCAALYLDFVKFVEQGGSGDWSAAPPSAPASEPPPAAAEPVPAGYLATWVTDPGAREYLEQHTDRFTKTLELTPAGGPGRRILEMGAYLQITPALRTKLGYEEVRGCYFGELGRVERKRVHSDSGEDFECEVAYFDAERDPYPYADEYFDTVLCCELLEHLKEDPMHLMAEINRILKPGGHLVLTTPNQASLRAISAILHGYHPGFFPAYLRNRDSGDARHAREYTAIETRMLLEESGFAVTRLETGPFRSAPRPELEWVITALRQFGMPEELRGDGTYIVGRKQGSVRMRHPAWLYA